MKTTIAFLADYPEFVYKVAELSMQQWHYYNPQKPLQEWIDDRKGMMNKDKLPFLLVALQGNELLGFIGAVESTGVYEDVGPWIITLFVKERYREQGIGSLLLETCLERLPEDKKQKVYLFTEDKAEFYRKRGWRLLERRWYKAVDVDIMCRDL
jgi:GNAT superfamily N-acetyltransferase